MFRCKFQLLAVIAAFAVMPAMASEAPPANHSEAAAASRMLTGEIHRNIGQPLPAGISFVDGSGKSVDLRASLQTLHGPVVLVVVTNCPPCDNLLSYMREHPDAYLHQQDGHGRSVHFAVLHIHDASHTSKPLPEGIMQLYSPLGLASGFLENKGIPAVFYFNDRMVLVKRNVGFSLPQALLRYPVDAQASAP
jgi:hypothetical protein